jgi:predicted AAA+ superfamily ATPase
MGFSPDRGRLYENLVAIALWRRTLCHAAEVFFWKGARDEEVDFVVKEGTKVVCLLQVCQAVDNPKTMDREKRALLKAGHELGCQNLVVLTETQDKTETMAWFGLKGAIRFVPLWKWLSTPA